jgi:hypothetical protein
VKDLAADSELRLDRALARMGFQQLADPVEPRSVVAEEVVDPVGETGIVNQAEQAAALALPTRETRDQVVLLALLSPVFRLHGGERLGLGVATRRPVASHSLASDLSGVKGC